jgi:hypothetical protein
MHEPAVALTDFALAAENALFAFLLWRNTPTARGGAATSARWFALFFLFGAMAGALGGAVHAFMPDPARLAYRICWPATMLSLGAAAMAGANAAAHLAWGSGGQRIVRLIAAAVFVGYCAVVLFWSQDFANALRVYLPAAIFLLFAFAVVYARSRATSALAGGAGMLLTFVAAGVQQSAAQWRLLHLDHNALYHIIQGCGLLLVYYGVRGLLIADVTRAIEP